MGTALSTGTKTLSTGSIGQPGAKPHANRNPRGHMTWGFPSSEPEPAGEPLCRNSFCCGTELRTG
eukprot:3473559-Heterocapsa_arctica.AAC.1